MVCNSVDAFLSPVETAETIALDQSPAGTKEWGFHPGDQELVTLNPPSFSWRPQEGAVLCDFQIGRIPSFADVVYRRKDCSYNVHTPAKVLESGKHFWRYRAVRADGRVTEWSKVRSFELPNDAVKMSMPERKELLDRIPKSHPRLFVRPEQMQILRSRAKSDPAPPLLRSCGLTDLRLS
jgi:hypothetical protein